MATVKTVQKVWGREEWLRNDVYCVKKLFVSEGKRCSWHYHGEKDELFIVHSGMVYLKYLPKVERTKLLERGWSDADIYQWAPARVLLPGEHFHVPTGMLHRFRGEEDSVIIESSTHHRDEDTFRVAVDEPCTAVRV